MPYVASRPRENVKNKVLLQDEGVKTRERRRETEGPAGKSAMVMRNDYSVRFEYN